MTVIDIFFWFFGASAILFALGVLFLHDLLHAAYALMGSMMSVAGLMLLSGAPFVAFAQLLVYIGGILILIIFGVFLTKSTSAMPAPVKNRKSMWGLAGILVVVLGLYYRFVAGATYSSLKVGGVDKFQHPKELGIQLVTYAAIPFQIVAILLLVVLVGATVYASHYEARRDD